MSYQQNHGALLFDLCIVAMLIPFLWVAVAVESLIERIAKA